MAQKTGIHTEGAEFAERTKRDQHGGARGGDWEFTTET
jgi:hypothetical protein